MNMRFWAAALSALFFIRTADAFDPFSVYHRNAPEGCLSKSVGTQPLALEDLIQIGICNNPNLNRNYMAVKSSEAAYGEAKAAYLPSVDAAGTVSREYEKTQDIRKSGRRSPWAGNVSLSWLLLDFGGRASSNEAMRAYLEASSASYDAALHDTVLAINMAYFDLLSAQEVLKSNETSVASYKKSYEETEKKYKVGSASLSDRLLAKTTYLQSRLAVTQTENDIRKNQANLAVLLNLPPETSFRLKTPPKDERVLRLQRNFSVRELMDMAMEARPELKSAESAQLAAQAEIGVAKSAAAPKLSFYGKGRYTDRWNETHPYTYAGEAGLQLDIPIFKGFSNMYAIARARYDYQQAVYTRKSTEDSVKNEVWSAYQDYMTAAASYEINQEVLKSAGENERVSRASYRAGKETILNLLTVQAQLAAARRDLIVSYYTVLIGKANLYRAVGKF